MDLSRQHLANHTIVVGKTGSGKSTLMENVAVDLIEGDEPCSIIVIDPLGSTAERLIDCIPPDRIKDTCYFRVSDTDYSIGFNPFAGVTDTERYVRAQDIKQAFHDVFYDSWGERLDWLAYNCIRLALDTGQGLEAIQPILNKKTFREKLIRQITDTRLLDFWGLEFPSYAPKYLDEAKGPLLNKVGQFMASPSVYRSMTQTQPKLDLATFMNERRILIVNLDAARLGEKTAFLFGAQLVSRISNIGMARRVLDEKGRAIAHMPLYVFIDEWQSIGNKMIARAASQWRQFDLHLFLANQYFGQIDDEVVDAILGNMGTIVSFGVAPKDADILVRYFHPHGADQLIDMARYHARVRLNPEVRSQLVQMKPFDPLYSGSRETVIEQSRRKYARQCSRNASPSSVRPTK